jgi:hypothetical protein
MRTNINIFFAILLSITFNSCKKKFDYPENPPEPAVSGYTNIARIKAKFNSYYNIGPAPTKVYKFDTDSNLLCTVIADEASGNIYKSVYVNDATGALKLNLTYSGGLNTGDKIRINLNSILLNSYGGVIQLDSINIEKKVVKIESGQLVTPIKVTMNQLIANRLKLQSQVIALDSVEFDNGNKNQPYADAVNKESIDRTIINAFGTSMIIRTSGYSSFASALTPCGKGSIIAVLGEYNGTIQLTLRQYNEVVMTSGTCPYLIKNFNDASITSGGWSAFNVNGNINWTIGTFGGKQYANITNYANATNTACETWLISPSLNLSSFNNPILSFISACNYNGPVLEVFISTNYSSGNPSMATWTPITANLSAGGFAWTNSGNISLTPYKNSSFKVGFKYTGTASSGKTWELDDISILEN